MGTRRAAYEGVARAARPTFAGGRWHKARMSAKNVARHRKAAVAAGEEWGGERAGSPLHINPLAGRRRMMQRPDRCVRSRPTLPQSRGRCSVRARAMTLTAVACLSQPGGDSGEAGPDARNHRGVPPGAPQSTAGAAPPPSPQPRLSDDGRVGRGGAVGRSPKNSPPLQRCVQYLIKSKTDAYEKRELHVYFDAELVRRSRCASMHTL